MKEEIIWRRGEKVLLGSMKERKRRVKGEEETHSLLKLVWCEGVFLESREVRQRLVVS